ncbi:MAG: hypothetical protein VKI83_06795 [Synechococcaceae cyanobacterium]|nr:hypothetical protein [Synechococcaceae cyanobacterium]
MASTVASTVYLLSTLHPVISDGITGRPDGVVMASSSPAVLELEAPYRRLAGALEKAGISIAVNTRHCATKQVVGFHVHGSGRIELCVDKVRSITSDQASYRRLLQATLAHEAAHVAQFCRRERTGGPPSLGIAAAKLYALPPELRQDLNRALGIANHNLPRSLAWRQEAEAFYLEDKPEQVTGMLARYC